MLNFFILWAACAAIAYGYMHSKEIKGSALLAIGSSLIVTAFLNIIQLIIKLIIGLIF